MKPLIVVNLKTYEQGTANHSVKLAKILKKFSTKADFIICPQFSDLRLTSKLITTYAQHLDAVVPGRNTGFISPYALRMSGVKGVVLNHSEHRLTGIGDHIQFAKDYGLKQIVCVRNLKELALVKKFKPDFIALEPPKLISTDISISTSNPDLIKKAAAISDNVLVGAGIKSYKDLSVALELGARGVLLSSHFVKSKSPLTFMKSFCSNL